MGIEVVLSDWNKDEVLEVCDGFNSKDTPALVAKLRELGDGAAERAALQFFLHHLPQQDLWVTGTCCQPLSSVHFSVRPSTAYSDSRWWKGSNSISAQTTDVSIQNILNLGVWRRQDLSVALQKNL